MTDQTVITAIRDLVWASIEDRLDDRIKDIVDEVMSAKIEQGIDEHVCERVMVEVRDFFDCNSFSIKPE